MRVSITMGDPSGIGPEIILKAVSILPDHQSTYIVYGHSSNFSIPGLEEISLKRQFFEFVETIDDVKGPGKYFIELKPTSENNTQIGKGSVESGRAAITALDMATEDLLRNKSDALVTAPISKSAVHQAGFLFPGHTEYLAHRFKTEQVIMMLVHQGLRVALQTIHTPLSEVHALLSTHAISTNLRFLKETIRDIFNEPDAVIDVLGLNPHAGDDGVLGKEELEIIIPAIKAEQTKNNNIRGPFPADGYFARSTWKSSSAVLAMYHDQGLIPFKMLDGGAGVNLTLGLPIVRTSPDHGTGFSIAGKGVASPTSMLMAIQLAETLTENRTKELKTLKKP